MTQIETINPANIPKPSYAPTENINKVAGKAFFITGYTHNRGKPTEYTPSDKIGEDGLTDYFTITTEESFPLAHKGEQQEINHFYVTSYIGSQIDRILNGASLDGKRIGPCKAVKRQKPDNKSQTYWALAFEKDEDFK